MSVYSVTPAGGVHVVHTVGPMTDPHALAPMAMFLTSLKHRKMLAHILRDFLDPYTG